MATKKSESEELKAQIKYLTGRDCLHRQIYIFKVILSLGLHTESNHCPLRGLNVFVFGFCDLES